MKSLGLNFSKEAYFVVVLEGDDQNVVFVESRKVKFPANDDRRDKINWLYNEILSLIEEFQPDRIGQRINFSPDSIDKLFTFGANVGASYLAASIKDVPIADFTTQSFSSKRFGFDKKVDKYDWIDEALGSNPPHWNKQMKDAAFSAWSALK
ncbi:hypothetical protein OCEANICA350_11668 [Oceanicaulis sp. 350]|nr:hypothetical protein OCEANICA350_11668 [Oceanicaulis sp. 350]